VVSVTPFCVSVYCSSLILLGFHSFLFLGKIPGGFTQKLNASHGEFLSEEANPSLREDRFQILLDHRAGASCHPSPGVFDSIRTFTKKHLEERLSRCTWP
jgi:hypothetical protein